MISGPIFSCSGAYPAYIESAEQIIAQSPRCHITRIGRGIDPPARHFMEIKMRKTLMTALGVLLIAGSAAQITQRPPATFAGRQRLRASSSATPMITQTTGLRGISAVENRVIRSTRTSIQAERPLGANSERGTAGTTVRKGAREAASLSQSLIHGIPS